jgi:hypothetical protein
LQPIFINLGGIFERVSDEINKNLF